MTGAPEPLRLRHADLYDPRVDAYLEEQAVLRRAVPEVAPQPLLRRILYASWFYLSIAAGLGGFCGWLVVEPFIDDTALGRGVSLMGLLVFPTVSGMIGLFLGAADGIICRNLQRTLICAAVGLGIGFGGSLVSLFGGGIIFVGMRALAESLNKNPVGPPSAMALLVLMMGRSSAWAFAAAPTGLGQGIALRSKNVILNGLLGAVLGGLLGGFLFDPISFAIPPRNGQAELSRAVGFTVIGIMVGLFVGLVEQWTKTAWLLMRAGPLAGKQFVLFRNPTVLGSSPKADIYLFKDDAIEPQHAFIHNRGGRYEIEDNNTPDGTYINGLPVQRQYLHPGDQIVLGKTVLEFTLKEAR